jgi:hypothetical protein
MRAWNCTSIRQFVELAQNALLVHQHLPQQVLDLLKVARITAESEGFQQLGGDPLEGLAARLLSQLGRLLLEEI